MTLIAPLSRRWDWSFRHLWPVLVIVIPCVLLALGGEPVRLLLRYDRAAILQGELWRLVSGNFVHLGWGHVLEDLAGYVLLWLLVEDVLPGWRCPVLVLGGGLMVGLGFFFGNPGLQWYVGLSGALNTVWAAGALALMGRRDSIGGLLGIFLGAKLFYEQRWGPLPFAALTTGGPVVVDAHLYGALAGILWGLLALAWRRRWV